MARKMDWEKARTNKVLADQIRAQAQEADAKADYYRLRDKGLWPVKGKNKGKPISSLDESYLKFIAQKFQGEPQTLALNELRKRKLIQDKQTNQARENIKALRQNK